MVVQTQVLSRGGSLLEQAIRAHRCARRGGRIVVGGAIVVVETAWLLTLTWGIYVFMF